MRKSHTSKRPHLKSFLPRGKEERRQIELLGGVSVMLVGVLIVGMFFTSSLQQMALRSSSVAAVVSAVLVNLANGDRSANGLGELTSNPTLVAVAQAKANDMAAKGYFAHVSPEGIDPWHWFNTIGYEYSFAGENLAVDFSDSGDVERAWMNSPTHRDNILNSKFTEIGIATAQGMYEGRATTFVVQVFATPVNADAVFAEVREVIPEDPTETAVASAAAESGVQVLGSATEETLLMTEPAVAAALAKEVGGDVPLWGYAVSFPQETLKYAYYVVAFLILVALAIEVRLEFRAHHQKKAWRAGVLLAVMIGLFFVADYAFFAEPLIAQTL